jgi:hypothetical protein
MSNTKRVVARQKLADDQSLPPDAAIVAASILLRRALGAAAVTLAETLRPGFVFIIVIPQEAWSVSVRAAWKGMINDLRAGDAWPDIGKVWAGDFKTIDLIEDVAAILASARPCTLFALQSNELPPEVLVSADRVVRLDPLDRSVIDGMLAELCGAAPTSGSLTDAEAAALTPTELRLAYRVGESADDFMGRLEDLLEARETAVVVPPPRKSVRSEPSMDRLHGMDEAVAWGRSLAADFAAYRAGELSWDAVDRGCLLSGPPGCGKTTFVRALAADCGVPLIAATHGEWQAAGHQGDMLKVMRKSFAAARKAAPSILFIDELDSFGDRAAVDSGSHNGSYELQVINALLAEVDGVQGHEGVVIIGACNYPEKLDPALVRSGRLDRHIRIPQPTVRAVAAILREHLGADLPSIDLGRLADLAAGFTGADCERLVRLARRRARSAKRELLLADLEAELLPDDGRPPAERQTAAVHEAGHAVAAMLLLPPGMLISVSLRPSGAFGGATRLRSEWTRVATAAAVEDAIVFLLAGRAAEEVLTGTVTTGAGGDHDSDLARATSIAVQAASAYGYGVAGLVWRGKPEMSDLPKTLAWDPGLTMEVGERLAAAYARALEFIERNRPWVARVADALLSRTMLDASEVMALVRGGRSGDARTTSAAPGAAGQIEDSACPTF